MQKTKEFTPLSRSLNVTLTEDDPEDRLLFEDALSELPATVHLNIIGNGVDLIDWLTKEGTELPDALFLDIHMPRKNGLATLRDIKRNPRLENIPVFVFSSLSNTEIFEQVYKDAAHYYIRKPQKFQELKTVIYKALKLVADKDTGLPAKDDFFITSS